MKTFRMYQRIGYRIWRVARVLEVKLEAELASHGLTRLMWMTLHGVGEDGVETPSELADYLGIARPSVSRMLHKMETRGLMRRFVDAGPDARMVRLALTETGVEMLNDLLPKVDAHNARICERLDPDELASLLSALDRLSNGDIVRA